MDKSDRTIRIIHTADFHLGNRFSKLKGNNVEEQRREDMYRNMDYIARFAVDNKVDIVLISGDIFHRPNPGTIDFVKFSEFVGKLVKNNIYVVAIAGNHDRPKTRDAKNPIEGLVVAHVPNFIYISRLPEKPIVLKIKDKKIGIVAIPYIDPRVLEMSGIDISYEKYIESKIEALNKRLDQDKPDVRILMLHIMLREADLTKIKSLYVKEKKIPYNSLHEKYFDYVALGHVHKPQKIGERIYYSGSIERMAFDEEHEEKSFNLIEIGPDGRISIQTKKLTCRPMLSKRLKIEETTISGFIDMIRGMEIPEGALLKINIDASREFLSQLDKYETKIRDILLNEKKVLGFDIERKPREIHTSMEIDTREEIDIKSEIINYIDSLRIDTKIKERAKELAHEIIMEVESK